jgi:hypothetical protein
MRSTCCSSCACDAQLCTAAHSTCATSSAVVVLKSHPSEAHTASSARFSAASVEITPANCLGMALCTQRRAVDNVSLGGDRRSNRDNSRRRRHTRGAG